MGKVLGKTSASLVKAGAGGNHPQNLSRDLGRAFLAPKEEWPCPYKARIPYDIDGGSAEFVFFLPHLYMHSMIAQLPLPVKPGSFAYSRIGAKLEASGSGLDPCTLYPLALWGDGVPFTKQQSLFVVGSSE